MSTAAASAILGAVLAILVLLSVGCQHQPDVASARLARDAARYWPRFRGPDGLGISAFTNVPTSWNVTTEENVLWQAPVPLPGAASPVVWGDRVFLVGADKGQREAYCFDASSGHLLWHRPIGAEKLVPPPKVHEQTGYAASTPATDGRRLYVIFPTGHLAALDLDGNTIWQRHEDLSHNFYGHATSLLLHGDRLIVQLDQRQPDEGHSRILALAAASGKTVWETARPVDGSWTTPIVINTGVREELITSATPWAIAYDPANGKELWRAKCVEGDPGPSPVSGNGLVFVVNIYSQLTAIRPGGTGDVTDTRVTWSALGNLPEIASPLTNGDLVFTLSTYGVLECFDAVDGSMLWEHDYDTRFSTSPSLVGDKVYLVSEEGVTFIIAAGREYRQLGRAELGEGCVTCPAFVDGRIYLRGRRHLFCLKEK